MYPLRRRKSAFYLCVLWVWTLCSKFCQTFILDAPQYWSRRTSVILANSSHRQFTACPALVGGQLLHIVITEVSTSCKMTLFMTTSCKMTLSMTTSCKMTLSMTTCRSPGSRSMYVGRVECSMILCGKGVAVIHRIYLFKSKKKTIDGRHYCDIIRKLIYRNLDFWHKWRGCSSHFVTT